ncbi:MAG: choice-of-anchor A family protein [Opitutus sp.]|nr:choice-of-anchor A family protein [Opitutus sp.]
MLPLSMRGQAYVQAVRDFDTMVREYNLISFGNATFQGQDSWGGLAVKGNLTLQNFTVAMKSEFVSSSDPSLYVAGQLILSGDSHLNNGYAYTPNASGTYNANSKQFQSSGGKLIINSGTGDPRNGSAPANWNWVTLESQAITMSQTLAAAQASGGISVNTNKLIFSANTSDAGVVIFNLDASQISNGRYNGQNFSDIQFAIGANQTAVVNVLNADGRTLFGNGNFNGESVAGRLLWNITGTGNVKLGQGGQFYGSVLAPQINLSNYNSPINGQIITGNLNYSNAELHHTPFNPVGVNVMVPEPSTYALWGVALCGLGFAWRRRQLARAAAEDRE